MTLRAIPAPSLPAVLDLFAAAMPLKPITARAAMLQAARSETWLFEADGAPIAAAMLYPLPAQGERLVELAFVCRPEIRAHLVALIHHAHLTRAALSQSGPVRVRAHVAADHLPGQRLAALCGMRLIGRFGAFDRFEFEGQPDGGACDPSIDINGRRRRRGLRR